MKRLWWIVLAGFLMSCASMSTRFPEKSDREQLADRIVQYWNAKKADDLRTIESMIDPDTTVDKNPSGLQPTASKYAGLVKMVDFRIDDLDMHEPDSASVVVTLQLSFFLGPGRDAEKIEQTVKDHWVKKNGTWYINLNRPSFQEIIEGFQKKSPK